MLVKRQVVFQNTGKPVEWWMSCESKMLPAEAGRPAGENGSVKTGLCTFLCVCGVFGLMLASSLHPTARQM